VSTNNGSNSGPLRGPPEAANAYRFEELKLLRHEIEVRSEEQQSMERYVLLADAAIYASLVFPKDAQASDVAWVAWYVPGLLALAALVRWRESVRMIRRLARYIMKVEVDVLGPGQGWESHLYGIRKEVPIAPGLFAIFWFALAVAPMALAGYLVPIGGDALSPLAFGPPIVAALAVLVLVYWPSDQIEAPAEKRDEITAAAHQR
jgi:hypothetical protein